ncbi:hypothetical protein LINPERHAP1_LOCUS25156 [Linum perenne]
MRDCSFACEVWEELGLLPAVRQWSISNHSDWLRAVNGHDNSLHAGITCWYLWKSRNELVFESKHVPPAALVNRILAWSRAVDAALRIERSCLDLPPQRTSMDVQWDPGPEDTMVINTDGSVNPSTREATTGGLIRDYLGRCYLGFSSNLGSCSIARAELHGIATGLRLAWTLDFVQCSCN